MSRVIATPGRDERQALVERILNSHAFESSQRLRSLLLYLAQRSDSDHLIREQEIGVAVFSRSPGYDTSHDTLVRVQISNLRKKLQQYFEEGSSNESWEIQIPKGNYALLFRPLSPVPHCESTNVTLPAVSQVPQAIPSRETTVLIPTSSRLDRRGFLTGLAVGLTIATVGGGLLMSRSHTRDERIPAAIASHPIWAPFRDSRVTVVLSTPLFFISENGLERDFRLNYAEDLAVAPKTLLRRPASPEWDQWASFSDVLSVARIEESLSALGAHTSVRSAREGSLADLRGSKTIVLGHPRGAPFLLDVMRDLDFRPPPRLAVPQNGFINVAPQGAESVAYGSSETNAMERSAETTADYALVTSLRIPPDGELLSLFGNRVQTSSLIVRKLLDPAFMGHLNDKVFRPAGNTYKSCQIVLRVDYSKGNAIDAVYVTHRIRR